MKKIRIYKNKITNNSKPYMIVEACVNHQGNFQIAKKMILTAKKAGAQCIKFQHHIIKEEMLEKNIPKSKKQELIIKLLVLSQVTVRKLLVL